LIAVIADIARHRRDRKKQNLTTETRRRREAHPFGKKREGTGRNLSYDLRVAL
jgi:hypothetical protein